MATQENSLKTFSFPKIQQFVRQLVRSVSGNNLVFYFSIISWLRLLQETMWVNINFERKKELHRKVTLPSMILEKPLILI